MISHALFAGDRIRGHTTYSGGGNQRAHFFLNLIYRINSGNSGAAVQRRLHGTTNIHPAPTLPLQLLANPTDPLSCDPRCGITTELHTVSTPASYPHFYFCTWSARHSLLTVRHTSARTPLYLKSSRRSLPVCSTPSWPFPSNRT